MNECIEKDRYYFISDMIVCGLYGKTLSNG